MHMCWAMSLWVQYIPGILCGTTVCNLHQFTAILVARMLMHPPLKLALIVLQPRQSGILWQSGLKDHYSTAWKSLKLVKKLGFNRAQISGLQGTVGTINQLPCGTGVISGKSGIIVGTASWLVTHKRQNAGRSGRDLAHCLFSPGLRTGSNDAARWTYYAGCTPIQHSWTSVDRRLVYCYDGSRHRKTKQSIRPTKYACWKDSRMSLAYGGWEVSQLSGRLLSGVLCRTMSKPRKNI